MRNRWMNCCLVLWVLLCLGLTALPVLSAEAAELMPETPPVAVSAVYYSAGGTTVIGYLENGTSLTVLGSHGERYHIDCYDMTGYIPKSQTMKVGDKYYVNCKPDLQNTVLMDTYPLDQLVLKQTALLLEAYSHIGVPYRSGGTSPKGFDCSGFTQYIFDSGDISITRTCLRQMGQGIIVAKEDLQPGDLVFFRNTTPGKAITSHVGVYLGGGKLIHAGSRGITVADLYSEYFVRHYLCARRMLVGYGAEPDWQAAVAAAA